MWTMTYYFLFLFTCSYPIQLKFAIVVTVHWHLAYLTETGICQYITLLLVLPCCSNRVFSSTSHYQCLVVHSACISHYHYLVVQTACISHYQCLAVQTEYSAVYHITITLLFKQSIQQYITLPIPCCSNRQLVQVMAWPWWEIPKRKSWGPTSWGCGNRWGIRSSPALNWVLFHCTSPCDNSKRLSFLP